MLKISTSQFNWRKHTLRDGREKYCSTLIFQKITYFLKEKKNPKMIGTESINLKNSWDTKRKVIVWERWIQLSILSFKLYSWSFLWLWKASTIVEKISEKYVSWAKKNLSGSIHYLHLCGWKYSLLAFMWMKRQGQNALIH